VRHVYKAISVGLNIFPFQKVFFEHLYSFVDKKNTEQYMIHTKIHYYVVLLTKSTHTHTHIHFSLFLLYFIKTHCVH